MILKTLALAIFISFQSTYAQQYPFIAVTGPNSPKEADVLLADHVGRLWVGTPQGLICFDGTRFFSLESYGFPSTSVRSLTEDDEGGIWSASDAGLHRFHRGRLEFVLPGVGTSIVSAAPGILLAAVGPPGGGVHRATPLYRIRQTEGRWRAEQLPNLDTEGFLSIDSSGTVLYPHYTEWHEITAAALIRWKAPSPLQVTRHPYYRPTLSVDRIIRDHTGCMWFRNSGYVMYQCPGDSQPQQLPLTVAEAHIWAVMHESADGSLILPSAGLLAIGRPGAFRVVRPMNGLPPPNDVLMTHDGTIWIASDKGLYRFMYPFRLEFWTERDGLVNVGPPLRVGNRIFVPGGHGVRTLSDDRSRWDPLPAVSELGSACHLLPGPGNTIFAALGYHGVVQFRTDGSIVRNPPPGIRNGMRLAQTPDGKLWLAAYGVERVLSKGNRFELVEEDLPGDHSNGLDMELDGNGTLWACYTGGLIHKEANGWRQITKDDGLLQSECRSIAVHPNGDIWYGYQTIPAFSRVRINSQGKPEILHFRSGGEVQTAKVHFFDVDGRGWLWRGAPDGIYAADTAEAEAGWWLHMDDTDGLLFNGPNQQAFYSDPDGSIWVGADNTLTHFSPPADFVRPTAAPAVFLSAMSWNHGEPVLAESLPGIPSRSGITAHLGSLQFDRRDGLRVRYRLLPDQPSWRDSRSLDLALGTVSWGGHTLEAQARIGDGPWSAVQRLPFAVLKPVWLSWPIVTAFLAINLAAALAGYRWRRKRRARAAKLLPDIALLRMEAISPDIHVLTGSKLDSRYEVGRILKRGGTFAMILNGYDRAQEGCRCAIKLFRRAGMNEDWLNRRFQQEVSALEQIKHPNVVRIYGHGMSPNGEPYLVMEFIDGMTLHEALMAGAMLPRHVGSLLRQAGSALDAIHSHGIRHRDLKPENIMLRSGGAPKIELVIIDFSIALVNDPDKTIQGLTRAAGTIEYMAPEQLFGVAEPASDIYSLTKVLIEMLTGLRLKELLPNATLDLPLRVRELLVERSFGLSSVSLDLISAALEFHPADRPQRAMSFVEPIADDLEHFNPDTGL